MFQTILRTFIQFVLVCSNIPISTLTNPEPQCHNGEGYCPANKCSLTPKSYEGPFFLPNQPIRNDIREGKEGVVLKIDFRIKGTNCKPVEGASIHLWQADAFGIYSGYSLYYPLGDPAVKQIEFPHSPPSENATFLRGIQITDTDGFASFTTIYPGWYAFRTLHVHFKIQIGQEDRYTGEIFFPDQLTNQVALVEPYNQRSPARLKNTQDDQFVRHHGKDLILRPAGNLQDGLKGTVEIVI